MTLSLTRTDFRAVGTDALRQILAVLTMCRRRTLASKAANRKSLEIISFHSVRVVAGVGFEPTTFRL